MRYLLASALLLALVFSLLADDTAVTVKAGTLVVLDSKTEGAKWFNAYKKDVQLKVSKEGWVAAVFLKPGEYSIGWYAKDGDPNYITVTVTDKDVTPLPTSDLAKSLKEAHVRDADPKGAKLALLLAAYEGLAEFDYSDTHTWAFVLSSQATAVKAAKIQPTDLPASRKAVGEYLTKRFSVQEKDKDKAVGKDGLALVKSAFGEVRAAIASVKEGLK